jgi:hypothetical protein
MPPGSPPLRSERPEGAQRRRERSERGRSPQRKARQRRGGQERPLARCAVWREGDAFLRPGSPPFSDPPPRAPSRCPARPAGRLESSARLEFHPPGKSQNGDRRSRLVGRKTKMASRNGQGHNPGQFQPGNPGGPGRPRRQTEREYLQALTECVSLTDWKAVVRRALDDARKGDHRGRNCAATAPSCAPGGTVEEPGEGTVPRPLRAAPRGGTSPRGRGQRRFRSLMPLGVYGTPNTSSTQKRIWSAFRKRPVLISCLSRSTWAAERFPGSPW